MSFVASVLSEQGIESTLIPNADGSKANLYATVVPQHKAGVMLSGHTDVVPVEGQKWTRPAFSINRGEWSLLRPQQSRYERIYSVRNSYDDQCVEADIANTAASSTFVQ